MASDTGHPLVVEFEGERHELLWTPTLALVDFLKTQGIKAPNACGEGFCGACIARLNSGSVTMPINEILDEDDLEDGLILGCQALPEGEAPIAISYD